MTLGKPKVAIGQAGGPTAVINASLVGFMEEAAKHFEVYGIVNALQGLAENWIVSIEGPTGRIAAQHRHAPGAFLGSGRFSMSEEDFEHAIRHLRQRDIHHVVLIGGNGTMWAGRELGRYAKHIGFELSVIGVPKTVDNDLCVTDHTPGYASAARYVAASVRDIGQDLLSMRNFESVRVIETMGRNVGWLAAASGLLKETDDQPPHLIYLPERPLRTDRFLDEIGKLVDAVGYATVVVSEGVCGEDGKPLSEIALSGSAGTKVLGGSSQYLAEQINKHLNIPVRSELLGMNQRCSQLAVSALDLEEADRIGRQACALLLSGENDRMLVFEREPTPQGEYGCRIRHCHLDEVVGREKQLPDHFIASSGTGITSAFKEWLRPLVGNDLQGYPQWKYPF